MGAVGIKGNAMSQWKEHKAELESMREKEAERAAKLRKSQDKASGRCWLTTNNKF